LNCWYLIGKMDKEFDYITKEEYARILNKFENVLSEVFSKDQTDYRLDRVSGRTFNDPMNLNYNGVTHFSSMSNTELNYTLRQLGLMTTAFYKSVNFSGTTPLTESLLGIKYVISSQDKGLGYSMFVNQGEYAAYRNNFALSHCFLVNESVLKFDPDEVDDPFILQNILVNLCTGNEKKYFLPITLSQEKLNNVLVESNNASQKYSRIDYNQQGSVEFTLINPEDQQVYCCFNIINNDARLFLNNQEIKVYLPVYNKKILDLGYHRRGEKLTVRLTFSSDGFILNNKNFYGLNETRLAEAMSPFQDEQMEDIKILDTSIEGTVTVRNRNLLFTSIPFDPGWRVFVDNEAAPIEIIGNAFIGVKLSEGKHKVLFEFKPQGMSAGMAVSAAGVVVLCYLILKKQKNN